MEEWMENSRVEQCFLFCRPVIPALEKLRLGVGVGELEGCRGEGWASAT